MLNEPSEIVTCSAGCKRTGVISSDGTPSPGWERLPISGRWRCPACWRELDAANAIAGTPAAFTPDPLPSTSIGALKPMPEAEPFRERVSPNPEGGQR